MATIKVWSEQGKEIPEITLKEGDLVRVALQGKWRCDNPLPGFFRGRKNLQEGEEVVAVELPTKLSMVNANGMFCSSHLSYFPVANIDHLQFLAKESAAFELFHLIGGLKFENTQLKYRLAQIRELI